jgi:hypothetical protein
MVLWAMAFRQHCPLLPPARRAINLVRTGYRAWVKSRQQALPMNASGTPRCKMPA